MYEILRRGIPIIVLLIVAGVFSYDRFVVKRRVVRMQAELMSLANNTSNNYTEQEIERLIGQSGELTYESNLKRVLKYTWYGYSPNPYELYVVFRKFRGVPIIQEATLSPPVINRMGAETENMVGAREPSTEEPEGEPVRPVDAPARSSGLEGT